MPFLADDERLIVVDQRCARERLDQAALLALASVGVRTVLLTGWPSWHEIEPEPGVYHWDVLDERVHTVLATGMKILLPIYNRAPDWAVPDALHGYADRGDGRCVTFGLPIVAVNPLHAETLARELGFIDQVCERYAAWGGVQCVYAIPYDGEAVVPQGTGYTEDTLTAAILARQEVFARHNDALWSAWHPAYARQDVGNEHVPALYAAMARRFPDHELHRIIWTFFTSPGTEWRADVDAKHWVGAEYADNVVRNAGRLARWGMWGMVCALRSWDATGPLEPWRVDRVAEALRVLGG